MRLVKKIFARVADQIWCVPSVRARLGQDMSKQDKAVLDLLIKIRLLSFAFVTSPVLSLVPYKLTERKELGLASFGIGTLSIVFWLAVFRRRRSETAPIKLIKNGALATILVNALLGFSMLYASMRSLDAYTLVYFYLFLQLFTGIPFALINGIDSKLSGTVFRSIKLKDPTVLSPNAEFRRCRAAGTTAASALGALAWSIVVISLPNAGKSPACYSLIFGLGAVPTVFLLCYLRQLESRIRKRQLLKDTSTVPAEPSGSEGSELRNEVKSSIKAIGCLEGLLQFSQIAFSLAAIKALFDKVPERLLLVIAVPLLFYAVNGTEQIGAQIFSRYQARRLNKGRRGRMRQVRIREHASLWTLVFAGTFFIAHWQLGQNLGWSIWLDVSAYGLFNIIKGFAGGLSEQWNEAISEHYPLHDEARFTTFSALVGRGYQIAAITFYYILNARMSSGSIEKLWNIEPATKALVATLTFSIFVLLAANALAYSWIDQKVQQPVSTWRVLIRSMVNPEERTVLFTQLLRVLFVASLILSNLLSLKVVEFGGWAFTHGSVFYVTLFVLINLISIFEGAEAAIKTVFLGIVSYFFVFIALKVSTVLPGSLAVDSCGISTENYNHLVGHEIAWLFFVSFLGYFATIPLDVWLVSGLRKHFARLSPIGIAAAVTFVCQLVDTFIFVWMGFFVWRSLTNPTCPLPPQHDAVRQDMTSMLLGQFSMKFSVYLVMYFPLYFLIRFCSKWLGVKKAGATS